MNKIFFVFLGGGIGSIGRHLISSISFTDTTSMSFPLATFITNLIGCFIIGLLTGKIDLNKNLNLLLVTGFCGGFTTFSTFSKETLFLISEQKLFIAITYVVSSIVIGIALAGIGFYLTNKNQKQLHY